jgi:hypothetical protein
VFGQVCGCQADEAGVSGPHPWESRGRAMGMSPKGAAVHDGERKKPNPGSKWMKGLDQVI